MIAGSVKPLMATKLQELDKVPRIVDILSRFTVPEFKVLLRPIQVNGIS